MEIGEKIYSSSTNTLYTVVQILKSGGQAEAGIARTTTSGKIFFIKRLLNIRYSDNQNRRKSCVAFENSRKRIYSQINTLTLPGASCTYTYDFFHDKHFYYVVTEWIDGFELCPAKVAGSLSVDEKLLISRVIMYSLMPFEANGIIHADIKPENIFLERRDNHWTSRVIDFESSFYADDPPACGLITGTEPYYSPELADYNNEDHHSSDVRLTTKSDIFALGVVLFELFFGYYPSVTEGEYLYESVLKGKVPAFPADAPEKLCRLIKRMIDCSPEKRPSVMETVNELKAVPGYSKQPSPMAPIIKINSIDAGEYRVHLYNLLKDSQLYYAGLGKPYVQYKGPFEIDSDMSLRFRVVDSAGNTYSFKEEIKVNTGKRCNRPIIKVNGDVVVINAAASNKIYYTIDGSMPTRKSNHYTGPFAVGPNVLVKAISTCCGWTDSEVTVLNSSSKIKMS